MGNVPTGNDVSVCSEYSKSLENQRLNQQISTNFRIETGPRTAIILSYTIDSSLVIIYAEGAQSFDLITSAQLGHKYQLSGGLFITYACQAGTNLILSLSTGTFKILDTEILIEKQEILPERLLPGIVTYMLSVKPNTFACGHTSGEITVWSLDQCKLINEFRASFPPTSVLAMAFTDRNNSLIVGYDNKYQGMEGTENFLEKTKAKIFSLETLKNNLELDIIGKCLSISVNDSFNIVLALATDRRIYAWNINGGLLVLQTEVPKQIFESFPFKLYSMSTSNNKVSFVVGFTDSSVAVFDMDNIDVLLWRAKTRFEGRGVVSSLFYDKELDCFVVGDSSGNVNILNNATQFPPPVRNLPLFSLQSYEISAKQESPKKNLPFFSLKENAKTEERKTYQEPTSMVQNEPGTSLKIAEKTKQKSEDTDDSRNLTPFEIFLREQKPKILEETPDLSHKEIVMRVITLWGTLSEAEKAQYETKLSESLASNS